MDRWTRLGVGVLALLAGFAACSGDDAGGGAASSGGPAGCDLANEPYCPAGDAQCIDGAWTCGGCDPHAIKDVACVDECGDPVPPGCLDRGWLCPEPGAGGCGGAGGAAGAGGGGAGCDPKSQPSCPPGSPPECIDGEWTCAGCAPGAGGIDCFILCDPGVMDPTCVNGHWGCPDPACGGAGSGSGAAGSGGAAGAGGSGG